VLTGIPALMRTFSDLRAALVAGVLGVGVLAFWRARPHIPKLFFPFLFALLVFWAATLIYNAPEIKRFRNIPQLLFFIDKTPWTPGHSVGCALGFAIITFLWRSWETPPEPPRDQDILLSGPHLISYRDAYLIAAQQAQPGEETIFWAGVSLPRRYATQHFVVIGAPGSGKSLTLQLLMQSAFLGFLPGKKRRAVIYDAKRDTLAFLAALFRGVPHPPPVYVFNPFDKRCNPWAMNKDVRDGASATQIAKLLLGSEGSRDGNVFFYKAAYGLLGGVIEALTHIARETWTLRDVMLILRNLKRVRRVVGHCPYTRYLLGKFLGDSQRDSDIEATIEAYLRPLSFVASNWYYSTKTPVSLSEWVTGEGIIVLGADPSLDVTLNALNAAIFQRIVELVRRQPDVKTGETRETWFILDELKNAGRFDNLDKLCSEGRSKGACVALGFQDIPGFYEVYGKDLGQAIIGVCNNKLFLQNGDQATIDYASKHFKEQEILEIRVSYSHSDSSSTKEGGGSTSQGTNVSRRKVVKPVVHSGLLKSLPQPEKGRVGIHGYADTARVGTNYPYRMEVPPSFLDDHLPRPDENTENFEERAAHESNLPEWTAEDLARLNLSQFPELLLTDEQPNTNTAAPSAGGTNTEPRRPAPPDAKREEEDGDDFDLFDVP
jgi:hypothetical protein